MKALSPDIIEALQAAVRLHWTAIEQYTAQAAHLARQGYRVLAATLLEDAAEERQHLDRLLARLEVLETSPATDHTQPNWPRQDVPGLFQANLSLEQTAAATERAGILTAREAGDEITAKILGDLLSGSEKSVAEIEAELGLITALGLQNYLANQTA